MEVDRLINELYESLKEQEEVIDALTGCSKNQTNAMRKNNLEEIKKAVAKQAYWAERLGAAGRKHLEIREQLESCLNLPAETKLLSIIECAPDELKEDLREASDVLSRKMQELKYIMETNNIFAKRALDVYSKILGAVNQAKGESYNSEGKMSGGGRPLINKRA